MTSQNDALWDINTALWDIYLFNIVMKIFHLWKMSYLTFSWHNSATSWFVFMRFSSKRLAFAAPSVYNNYTKIVKTLSFDLPEWWRDSSGKELRSMRCSVALCLAVALLMQFLLYVSYRRSTWLPTSRSTWPSSSWRKHLIEFHGMSSGGQCAN